MLLHKLQFLVFSLSKRQYRLLEMKYWFRDSACEMWSPARWHLKAVVQKEEENTLTQK